MNSLEAKKGFLTFLAVSFLVSGIAFVGKELYDLRFGNNPPTPEKSLTVEPVTPPENLVKEVVEEPIDNTPKDINGDGLINSLDFPFNLPLVQP